MKILIISHNPISSYSNIGKTLGSLFDSFSSDELCQLYIYPSIPDYKKCSSYFRISDIDVLRSIFRSKKGSIIEETLIAKNNGVFENPESEKQYSLGAKKTPFKIIARDIVWKTFGWKSRALYDWIRDEKPTHIFVLPGRFKFIHRIALSLSKKFSLPIVSYVCDDFYFVKKPKSITGRINLFLYKKEMDKLMKKTTLLVSISKEMTDLYRNRFGVKTLTLMTGTNNCINEYPREYNEVRTIRYFGNISIGRYRSIADIGKAIDYLNEKHNIGLVFQVYSGEVLDEAKELFSSIKCIDYKGLVLGEHFKKLFFESPILIHAESFCDYDVDIVKHSVSTKIADSLSSGNVLFAYGPKCVSSIAHLLDNNYPAVVTDKRDLIESLEKYVLNSQERVNASLKGLEIAKRFHDSTKTSKVLKTSLEKE